MKLQFILAFLSVSVTTLISFLSNFLIFIEPISIFLILSIFLIVYDTIFAIVVKKRVAKKRKLDNLPEDLSLTITSNRFSKVIFKILAYESAIFMAFLLDISLKKLYLPIIGSIISMPFVYFVLLVIIIRELMSIDETMKLNDRDKGLLYYFNHIGDVIIKIKDFIKKITK